MHFCASQIMRNFTDTTKVSLSYNDTLLMDYYNATAELSPAAALLGFPLGKVDASFVLADADIKFGNGLP